jgi:hypothetical protein
MPQLRQAILQTAARHDATLTLEAMRTTRVASDQQRRYPYGQYYPDTQVELEIAGEVLNKDVAVAAQIAREALNRRIDYGVLDFLQRIQVKDKDAATGFLNQFITKLQAEDFDPNSPGFSVILNLISVWIESNRPASDEGEGPVKTPLGALDKRVIQGLLNNVIKRALNSESSNVNPNQTNDLLRMMQPMMPELEKLAPSQLPALRQRIAEMEKFNPIQQNPWAKYQEAINNGTTEDALEAAKHAPPEMQENLYQQTAWKALNQGNPDLAREIIRNNISEPSQRREMMANVDRQQMGQAAGQGKFNEARAFLARLPTIEERVSSLCQFAAKAAESGDKALALQLLNEAQALVSGKAQNYGQMQAQMQVATASFTIEPNRAAPIFESIAEQLNDLAVAAAALNGFDIAQYFRDGELIVDSGNGLCNATQNLSMQLGAYALQDFDRARAISERLQRPEMRVRALLFIAQYALATEDSPINARGIGMATGILTYRRWVE